MSHHLHLPTVLRRTSEPKTQRFAGLRRTGTAVGLAALTWVGISTPALSKDVIRRVHTPDPPNTPYVENQFRRCNALRGPDKIDCIARMAGEGTRSGSVEGGGIYRELITREVQPSPPVTIPLMTPVPELLEPLPAVPPGPVPDMLIAPASFMR